MFEYKYEKILEKIESFDPRTYKKSRNFLNGNVSYISPYVTAGVISQKQIVEILLKKFTIFELKEYIFELAWREFFYSVWEFNGDRIFEDMKNSQEGIVSDGVSKSVLDAKTGIKALDSQILELKNTGYMHNHARMWTASVVCNFAGSPWIDGAKWMYYYLLDGDLASNTLSWQWVCGSFSSKKYWFNQDNVNKYSGFEQKGTFADRSYRDFPLDYVPKVLDQKEVLSLETSYPSLDEKYEFEINDENLSVELHSVDNLEVSVDKILLVHPWSLNINEIRNFKGEKIFFIDKSFFNEFAISEQRLNFYFALAANVSDMKICIGEYNSLSAKLKNSNVYYVAHPMVKHWKGICLEPQKMFPELKGREFRSFFGFWKKAEKMLDSLVL